MSTCCGRVILCLFGLLIKVTEMTENVDVVAATELQLCSLPADAF